MDEGERIIRAERAKLLELKDQRAKQLRGMEARPLPPHPQTLSLNSIILALRPERQIKLLDLKDQRAKQLRGMEVRP